MNQAFWVLMLLEHSWGKRHHYKQTSGLMLHEGIQGGLRIETEVVGKPSPEFFQSSLQAIELEPQQAVVIREVTGSDVSGVQ